MRTSPRVKCVEDKPAKRHVDPSPYNEELHEKILRKVKIGGALNINFLRNLSVMGYNRSIIIVVAGAFKRRRCEST